MGKKAKGALFKIGDGAGPEVFTTIAELTSIGVPEFGHGTIETTNFDSANEEHIADGIVSHGEVNIEGNWLPGNATQGEATGLLKAAKDGIVRNFQIAVEGKTFTFPAIVRFKPTIGGPRDALKFSAALKIAGAVTIA